jgi:hypothetical protein
MVLTALMLPRQTTPPLCRTSFVFVCSDKPSSYVAFPLDLVFEQDAARPSLSLRIGKTNESVLNIPIKITIPRVERQRILRDPSSNPRVPCPPEAICFAASLAKQELPPRLEATASIDYLLF